MEGWSTLELPTAVSQYLPRRNDVRGTLAGIKTVKEGLPDRNCGDRYKNEATTEHSLKAGSQGNKHANLSYLATSHFLLFLPKLESYLKAKDRRALVIEFIESSLPGHRTARSRTENKLWWGEGGHKQRLTGNRTVKPVKMEIMFYLFLCYQHLRTMIQKVFCWMSK